MTNYLISICIPTYNGEDVLAETLDSIIKEIKHFRVEIVINDDKSQDSTLKIANEYASKYPYISVYKNQKNLRMDRNFTATALKSNGKYVWLCGQDDILQNGIIEKAITSIEMYPNLNFIYFNYKFVDDSLSKELMPPPLNIDEDAYFETMEEYFTKIDHAPSFLPANMMKKEFWVKTNYEQYYDTYYVQTGVWLENFYKGNVLVIASSNYVLCRIPLASWKNDDGQMIFETATGNLKAYKIAYNSSKIPKGILETKKNYYMKRFFLSIVAGKSKGLVFDKKLKRNISFIFKKELFSLAYITFLSAIPARIARVIYISSRKIRQVFREILN